MKNAILERVRAIIVRELCVEPSIVTPNASLQGEKLKADSLDLVNLVLAFAIEFDLEMRDREVAKIVTVNDVVNYLALAAASSGKSIE